jgi:hypothetical protein
MIGIFFRVCLSPNRDGLFRVGFSDIKPKRKLGDNLYYQLGCLFVAANFPVLQTKIPCFPKLEFPVREAGYMAALLKIGGFPGPMQLLSRAAAPSKIA